MADIHVIDMCSEKIEMNENYVRNRKVNMNSRNLVS